MIIVIGVGIFGTFTGYLANLFLSPKTDPDSESDAGNLAKAPPAPDATFEELRAALERTERDLAEIKRLLDLPRSEI